MTPQKSYGKLLLSGNLLVAKTPRKLIDSHFNFPVEQFQTPIPL